jgi:hypothetical protein
MPGEAVRLLQNSSPGDDTWIAHAKTGKPREIAIGRSQFPDGMADTGVRSRDRE